MCVCVVCEQTRYIKLRVTEPVIFYIVGAIHIFFVFLLIFHITTTTKKLNIFYKFFIIFTHRLSVGLLTLTILATLVQCIDTADLINKVRLLIIFIVHDRLLLQYYFFGDCAWLIEKKTTITIDYKMYLFYKRIPPSTNNKSKPLSEKIT